MLKGAHLPLWAAAWMAAACSTGLTAPAGPAGGVLSLTVATDGTPLDTGGYVVQLDSGLPLSLPLTGTLNLDGVPAGSHSISLDRVSANCAVGGTDPRLVTVTAGDTTRAGFVVTCVPPGTVVAGTWDWTEHFDDPSGSTCDDTGTYVFHVTGAGFAGRSDQYGDCYDPDFGFTFPNASTDDSVSDGTVTTNGIRFLVGGPGGCIYTAGITSTDHVAGTAVCGTSTGTWRGDRGLPLSLSISPATVPLPPGVSMQFGATLRNSLGNRVLDRLLAWTSDDLTVVSVDTLGYMTSGGPGVAHVSVSAGGAQATSTVTVGGVSVTDPAGDTTVSAEPAIDVQSLTAVADSNYLTVAVGFTAPPQTTVYGYVDLDVDQNPGTGTEALVDQFRTDSGSSGLGDEFVLDLGYGTVYETTFGDSVGTATVWYDYLSNSLVALIPAGVLGSRRGGANLAAVVGNELDPTDIVPNDGHLSLGTPPGSALLAFRGTPARRSGLVWRHPPARPSSARVSSKTAPRLLRKGGHSRF